MTLLSDITLLKQYLMRAISAKLPGESAHLQMIPSSRVHPKEIIQREDAKKSGVLLLLYPKNDEIYICFIRRTSDGYAHSGQISFPGGKAEPSDKNIIATALRECHEEVGVNPKEIQVIGKMTNLYIPVSNFMVNPILGITNKTPNFTINKSEVAYMIEVPLYTFLDNTIRKEKEMRKDGYTFSAPYYEIGEDHIWGASSMIMSELIQILKKLNSSINKK